MSQCLPQVVNPTKNVVSSQKIVWCDEKWSYVTGIILLEYALLSIYIKQHVGSSETKASQKGLAFLGPKDPEMLVI